MAMMAMGGMGRSPTQSASMNGMLEMVRKWPKTAAPVMMKSTMQDVLMPSRSASTVFRNSSLPLNRPIRKAPKSADGASLGGAEPAEEQSADSQQEQ